jgi:hypothetical protein
MGVSDILTAPTIGRKRSYAVMHATLTARGQPDPMNDVT